jgi:hypothetical protein
MNQHRLLTFAARVACAFTAVLMFEPAMAMDEYVVYGTRTPPPFEIDRALPRVDLEQYRISLAESVRVALAEALKLERAPRDIRFASNDPRPRG